MAAPLWVCPDCGHGFVTANIWHSCMEIPGLQAWLCESYSLLGMQAAPFRRGRAAPESRTDR